MLDAPCVQRKELIRKRVTFSGAVGFIYVFNLIVGTGVLALPKAVQDAGWLVSIIFLIVLCFFSYLSATFIIEAMSLSNGIKQWRCNKEAGVPPNTPADIETLDDSALNHIQGQRSAVSFWKKLHLRCCRPRAVAPLQGTTIFEMLETIELGHMANLLFNEVGKTVFYISFILYMYGDLAIYTCVVGKSLRDVICTHKSDKNFMTEEDKCWDGVYLRRFDFYRVVVAAFVLIMGSFVFFNIGKMMFIQILSTLIRWFAIIAMVILSLIRIHRHGPAHPPHVQGEHISSVLGTWEFAFMCHHSIPQMITPIRNKKHIHKLYLADVLCIFFIYLLLSFSAVFAVDHIMAIYSLNFDPNFPKEKAVTNIIVLQYIIVLYPVFTLSANYPVAGITLRNNIRALFMVRRRELYPWIVDRIGFPMLALSIPTIIALVTSDLGIIISITGAYPGTFIQFVWPACFVFYARKTAVKVIANEGGNMTNPFSSPFRSSNWCYVLFVFSIICLCWITAHYIVTAWGTSWA